MKILGDTNSGNCLKVLYTADHLGLPYEFVPVDIAKGESRTPAFLAKSLMGQVPVVEFDDGRCLAQSNAIIRYLASDSRLLPDDPFLEAKVDELLFWEQYSHEPYVAVCRFQMVYLGKSRDERDPMRVERAEKALDFMEARLGGDAFFVGGALSVADIALLAYTRLSSQGGFDLTSRPGVRKWIARCEEVLGLEAAA
ncbi:glutathione S-transferase [Terrihabitans soli]|uniref:Glutathione S-transferase n=1 Tax=Terrihabitans soli TaxID=708113 RepID=A0A6S6QPF5_9HYPH|nr:glutathione S-transferase family protein [Terrihabitans soli]BCJ89807.1 glutathione S-transferase [Terrihabitans soli]